ncbi:50S ribosomal protein L31 [Candidatus Sneabacter namystus]|uniref:50S ribosomal protein L31 n=1 Tax=Candidatus Sneabacter namystus TaxID=2601646 RepID=A0A5C0UI05_9RICK|nr:50S ribosomal protein L31 [Candidatus Sneabacter namystus]QEK39370.1 50S ribosomal protein L31 [Candidatus Sneabacter namystus]
MKKNIHPEYSEITVKIGKDEFKTMSTSSKKTLFMDVDFRQHPAWTKKGVVDAGSQSSVVNKFQKKYKDLGF